MLCGGVVVWPRVSGLGGHTVPCPGGCWWLWGVPQGAGLGTVGCHPRMLSWGTWRVPWAGDSSECPGMLGQGLRHVPGEHRGWLWRVPGVWGRLCHVRGSCGITGGCRVCGESVPKGRVLGCASMWGGVPCPVRGSLRAAGWVWLGRPLLRGVAVNVPLL